MGNLIAKRSMKSKLWGKLVGLFLVEPVSFSSKPKINFKGLKWLLSGFLGLFCLAVMLAPNPDEQTRNYHEQANRGSALPNTEPPQAAATQNALKPATLHTEVTGFGGGGGSAATNRNTSMIIARDNDISTTLPPGTKFIVKLAQAVTVTNRPIPVIGIVTSTVSSESGIAIAEGSKIFGDATLDSDSERASISWKSIMFPDGRSKSFSALALGADNQAGIEGDYHSDAFKNTAGQLIGRFVGGVADGAIIRTPFGANAGGIENGLLQGVADTAKDRTDAWTQDMKKPHAWIELQGGVQFQVILSQPFIFRDPGGVN